MTNLSLFALTIAKVLLLTGLGPAIAIATLLDRFGGRSFRLTFRRKRLVFKFPAGGQLAPLSGLVPDTLNRATSPPRKVRRSA
ncbi:MAG TPA: hypothetical protein VFF58_00480 [Candidatus Nitrosotalea sp.]|nr:hypothetical protein [Candidatus Nitrosotalea sp.]